MLFYPYNYPIYAVPCAMAELVLLVGVVISTVAWLVGLSTLMLKRSLPAVFLDVHRSISVRYPRYVV